MTPFANGSIECLFYQLYRPGMPGPCDPCEPPRVAKPCVTRLILRSHPIDCCTRAERHVSHTALDIPFHGFAARG